MNLLLDLLQFWLLVSVVTAPLFAAFLTYGHEGVEEEG